MSPSRSGCTADRPRRGGAGRGGAWSGGGDKSGRGASRGVPRRSKEGLIPVAPVASVAPVAPVPLAGGWRAAGLERAAFGVGPAGGGTVGGDVLRHRVVCLPGELANPKAGASRHPGS